MSASLVSLPQQAVKLVPQKASTPRISLNKSPPPITGFDRRTGQKLTRGNVEIESRLDLHGMNLEEARIRLLDFISSRRMQGHRLVLVITGKGASPFSGHTLHGRDHFYAPERKAACAGNANAARGAIPCPCHRLPAGPPEARRRRGLLCETAPHPGELR